MIDDIITVFLAISFIVYGITSFYSMRMISEYRRWGYQKLRPLIASFQLFAGIGLFTGMHYPFILILFSFLLCIMMMVAIFARIRIKDTIINTFPAVFYMVLNFIIFYNSLHSVFTF